MIRLVVPLFAITAVLWTVVYVLSRSQRRVVLREVRHLLVALGVGFLVLLLVSVVFLLLENVK